MLYKEIGVSMAAIAVAACGGDAASSAQKLIAECAGSALVGSKHIRYTGPMPLSEGQLFVRLAPDLVVPGPDAKAMFGDPLPANFLVKKPPVADCANTKDRHTDLKAELGVTVATLPVSGQLKTDLSRGQLTSATVSGFTWQWVNYVELNAQLARLPENDAVRSAVRKGNTEIVIGALRVANYRAEVDLTQANDVDLSAKYSGPLTGAMKADLGAGVQYVVKEKGKIVLTIPGETYVAGVFRPISAGGQVESGGGREMVTINEIQVTETAVQGMQ